MKSTFSSHRLLLGGAWIGTAVLAYALGQLRTPSDPTPATSGAQSSRAPAIAAANLPNDDTDLAGAERFAMSARDASTATLESIIGNQSLGDYLKRVLNLDDDIARTTAFLQVLETLKTPEQIREALEAVAKSGRGWGRGVASREFSMLLQKWTALDPKGAAEYATKLGSREERFMATSAVIKAWSRHDLDGALAWARANGIAETADPGSKKNGDEGNLAVAIIASQLARTDVSRALTIAMEDANSRSTVRLTDTLVAELFHQRGEAAARDAVLAMPESKLRESMIAEHADRLAKSDGAASAQFAVSLPAGDARSRALSEAIAGWAEKDPTAAGNFLNSIPASPESDAARGRFAREVLDKDPVSALSWAATISSPEDRQHTTERLIESWFKRDDATAKAWVLQSPFSDETKQRLIAEGSRKKR